MDNNEENKNIDVDKQAKNKQEEKVVTTKEAMINFIRVPLLFGFSFLNSVVEGFILSKMWQWFILSKFPNAPIFTWVDAFGISWMINFVLNEIRTATVTVVDGMVPANVDILSFHVNKYLTKIFVNHPLTLFIAWMWWKYVVFKHV
jgi:hypothetical protein